MAVATGALIVGGAAIASAVISSNASNTASKRQKKAAKDAIKAQEAAALKAEETLSPFVEQGVGAREDLQNFLDNPNQQLDEINPIVDFLQKEGFEQIQESAAAKGRLGAGGTLKDLTRFNTNLTSTVIPQLQNDRFNQLFNTAALGQNAATGQATSTLQTGANIANLNVAQGQASANNAINQANIATNFAGNIAAGVGAFPGLFKTQQVDLTATAPQTSESIGP